MTVRQRKFAALAAQGARLVDAHEQVYGPTKGKRQTRMVDASKLAARPDVAAAIAEYEAQLLPIGDLRECKLRMLANIQHLAYHSPDHKVRLAASIDLRNYIEEREQREARANSRPLTLDSLISEIRQLEAPEPTLELEAEADSDSDSEILTSDNRSISQTADSEALADSEAATEAE